MLANSLRFHNDVNLHSIEGMAVVLVFRGLGPVRESEVCLNMGTAKKISGGSPHAEVVWSGRSDHLHG